MTHPVYLQLLSEITDGLERKVLEILLENPTERIDRRQFVHAVFGRVAYDLTSNTDDRQIRECIERLRAKGWPIVSSSGEAGYVLEDNEERIREFAAEQESRAAKNRQAARAAYGWLPRARSIREARRTAMKVTQPGLL